MGIMQETKITARQFVRQVLSENPEGFSKNELYRRIVEHQGSCNTGAYRRLIQSMLDDGDITLTEVDEPLWGLTKWVRAAEPS